MRHRPCIRCGRRFWGVSDFCPACAIQRRRAPDPGIGWVVPLAVFAWLCAILALTYWAMT